MIPVRCFTCGKVVGNKWEPYQQSLKNGCSVNEALDSLGLARSCCRGMLMTHIDLTDDQMDYDPKPKERHNPGPKPEPKPKPQPQVSGLKRDKPDN
ncbi:uncharacterized protein LOC130740739 [Lotus japonicus]|uniref:uncharacterized protein LOC130740739 n=1 Tax=Lotus japonicus TaxID=34305 RepID=UPI00259113B8|nr:uncharacterized protein LOC130740739 [Lotus japonicus]